MTCVDIYRLLSEGNSPAGIRSLATGHLTSCRRCAQLVSLFEEPLPLPYDEPARRTHVAAPLLQEISPAPPLASPARIVAGVLAAIGLLPLIWVLAMGGPGFDNFAHAPRFALLLYAVMLATLLAFSLSNLVRPAAPAPLPAVWLLAAVGVGYPFLASLLFPLGPHGDFLADGLRCLMFGFGAALPCAALVWSLVHRGYFRQGALAGALIGATGGVGGLVVLHFVCANHDLGHLLLWHGALLIASEVFGGVAGFLLARRAAGLR